MTLSRKTSQNARCRGRLINRTNFHRQLAHWSQETDQNSEVLSIYSDFKDKSGVACLFIERTCFIDHNSNINLYFYVIPSRTNGEAKKFS
jgi:hypothetical protein